MGKMILAIAVVLLSACATPTTGVVPDGQGLYTVTRQGDGFWVTTESLKVAAINEANSFCGSKNKNFKLVHSKEIPAGPLGRWPETEILFDCI